MPNWCENEVVISGNRKMISILTKLIHKNNKNLFQGLVGINPNVTLEYYKTGDNWYQANCDYWGCKWDTDIEEDMCSFEDEYIHLNFETAWAPAIGFCREVAKKYKVNVEVSYYESVMDFAGKESFEAVTGIEEINESYTVMEGYYINDNERFWNDLEYTLEYFAHENDTRPTPEELISQNFDFVSEEDKEEIIKLYKEECENEEKDLVE